MAIAMVTTVVIILLICFLIRKTKQQLRDICMHDLQLSVIRNGLPASTLISSKELVPGDIIEISSPI